MKNTFHDFIVDKISKKINGKINNCQSKHHKKGNENPDIIKHNINYEVEIYNHYSKWKRKYDKYRDKGKKHILVITFDYRLYEFFDKIVFCRHKCKKKFNWFNKK